MGRKDFSDLVVFLREKEGRKSCSVRINNENWRIHMMHSLFSYHWDDKWIKGLQDNIVDNIQTSVSNKEMVCCYQKDQHGGRAIQECSSKRDQHKRNDVMKEKVSPISEDLGLPGKVHKRGISKQRSQW